MPNHPEPVPAASQLAVLPFLSAIEGILTEISGGARLRVTMHRVMTRELHGYVQQLCTYLGTLPNSQKTVGRIFPIDTGIMGRAIQTAKILRTRRYPSLEALRSDLAQDLAEIDDRKKIDDVSVAYLAIPFLGPSDNVVLALYAECNSLNFFSDIALLKNLLAMCDGFCRLFDWLSEYQPFPNLRNFPLPEKTFKRAAPTIYRRLQEEVDLPLPRFHAVTSFNYDASVG